VGTIKAPLVIVGSKSFSNRNDSREAFLRGARTNRAIPRWLPPVNWVDLILLGVLVLFGLRGFFRGLFREIFSIAGLVAGFFLAVTYARFVTSYVEPFWQISPLLLKGSAFVAIFFIVYFLMSAAGWILHRSERLLFLKTLNRTGGIVIGLAKGAALLALAIFFLSQVSWLPRPTRHNLDGSYLATPLSYLAESLIRIGKARIFFGESSQHAWSPNDRRV
jgi:membrane protein required for colicin V production